MHSWALLILTNVEIISHVAGCVGVVHYFVRNYLIDNEGRNVVKIFLPRLWNNQK
jgi:hypothetical protein